MEFEIMFLWFVSQQDELLQDETEVELSSWGAAICLAVVTALIAYLSNNLVDTIEVDDFGAIFAVCYCRCTMIWIK